MRAIRLHDTRSGELRLLAPSDPRRVRIYACGPTVYGRIHLGNARPFVVFSVLKRLLAHEGRAASLVVNVTDVNDKIYDAARAQGRRSAELAADMAAHYRADTDALGLGRPDREPLASESMDAIIALIDALVRGGHAYVADGDVYFRVRADERYGELSHRRLDDMDQGEGVEGSERKRDPLDFALWKAHKPGEDTAWESPWGRGRPGWHIECSAMAELDGGALDGGALDGGAPAAGGQAVVDIHGGGSDLVFPHHENEAAQTRAARGCELAQIWMHNGMVHTTGQKMAKSVGNIAPLHEALARYGREAVVMYLISGHYRQPLAFSDAALQQARANVDRIREAGRRLSAGASHRGLQSLRERFFQALARDFNTPEALAIVNEWLREAPSPTFAPGGDAQLREMLGVLGLDSLLAAPTQAPEAVRALAEQRERARRERDFAAADHLREQIAALGWEVRDVPGGFELLPLG
jgi:cysteinyl-tRNA synthetase